MNKSFYFICLLLMIATTSCDSQRKNELLIERSFDTAIPLYENLLKTTTENLRNYPHSLHPDGSIKYLQIDEWTGGFWPGILWYIYEYTEDEKWKKEAISWTESLVSNQYNTAHHDIGFMMYCSYGNAIRFLDTPSYKEILVQSAKSLCERYNEQVGSIQSWNTRKSKGDINIWEFPVIMDNMMNLELLFYASKVTKDSSFRDIAISHALQTLAHHVRPDYSSFHVVNYNPDTGKALHKQTLQGFSDNSTWARGQAWGIYGFTMVYRETGDKRFLSTAEGMADFFLDHPQLPEDKIPYWDFNVGEEGYHPDWDYQKGMEIPRDASAAAITASALLELRDYVDTDKCHKYEQAAYNMLSTLASEPYLNIEHANPYYLLKHSTGNFPSNNEVDVPLIYADYYFLEALHRLQRKKDHTG
ncbi:glycoside hydrolase family 88 protein [Sphingobacterium gobiense]|uniref:Glucuronyl hydrolase n=1 Tax=Sphingobacterium gobiense TaxID=1382456 RepID=A0A2S9JIG9_9SPHI|nr:glycoside hydrolase family 88 protein [Sphingobacterium gobiense]PRD52791.1 glucuronyl hydrolase [Sphingobacterium gobiense]